MVSMTPFDMVLSSKRFRRSLTKGSALTIRSAETKPVSFTFQSFFVKAQMRAVTMTK